MTLLIVDDERPMRDLVTRVLAPLGHTLLQAVVVCEHAFDQFLRRAGRPGPTKGDA